jgi:hypothetical protein
VNEVQMEVVARNENGAAVLGDEGVAEMKMVTQALDLA